MLYLPSLNIFMLTILVSSGFNEVLLFSFAAFAIAFVFFVFVWYRQHRENDFRLKEALFAREVAEVEMKALRAQLNPHFIFNSLNSIYNFLQQNNTDAAAKYLVKFSSLIRMILENSAHQEISLADDLKAMELYIKIEQMRMQQKFAFAINVDNALDAESILVPPMIIQPFLENSIWHGLNNKAVGGMLTLNVNQQNNMLVFLIEDNGEEQTSSSILNEVTAEKKKSMGMGITRERLDMLNKTKNKKADFKITDIRNAQNEYAGKRVEVSIEL
jgi:LytS/YehU family sensor histidine kinase